VTAPYVAHTSPLGWKVGFMGGDALRRDQLSFSSAFGEPVTAPHVVHTWPLGWTVGSIGGDALILARTELGNGTSNQSPPGCLDHTLLQASTTDGLLPKRYCDNAGTQHAGRKSTSIGAPNSHLRWHFRDEASLSDPQNAIHHPHTVSLHAYPTLRKNRCPCRVARSLWNTHVAR